MKKLALITAFGILITLTGCAKIQSPQNVPRISKDSLKAELGSPGMVLIDVRTENDWEASSEKIAGAIRKDPETFDSWASALPKDKEIILYCA